MVLNQESNIGQRCADTLPHNSKQQQKFTVSDRLLKTVLGGRRILSNRESSFRAFLRDRESSFRAYLRDWLFDRLHPRLRSQLLRVWVEGHPASCAGNAVHGTAGVQSPWEVNQKLCHTLGMAHQRRSLSPLAARFLPGIGRDVIKMSRISFGAGCPNSFSIVSRASSWLKNRTTPFIFIMR